MACTLINVRTYSSYPQEVFSLIFSYSFLASPSYRPLKLKWWELGRTCLTSQLPSVQFFPAAIAKVQKKCNK